ncbi:hypothetical protein [Thalassorhabdomicrobium marinisediminis]|uniref:hypothetical protein n=1 Tax=Thalassorhabdomicrobium marinisediminis TaxID=2170577 RepID=UPI0011B1D130|nr:hypothetical protein [Thalassorhabdomicrobium marinisediminis]
MIRLVKRGNLGLKAVYISKSSGSLVLESARGQVAIGRDGRFHILCDGSHEAADIIAADVASAVGVGLIDVEPDVIEDAFDLDC